MYLGGMWKACCLLSALLWAQGAIAQSGGGLGGASDAAQRRFDQRFRAAPDSTYDAGGVEVPPEFPGGTEAMYAYLKENTVYPPDAEKDRLEGRVYVRFIIRPDGRVDNVELARGKHPLLDAEALRVVRGMPAWKPGLMHGKPVTVRMVQPFSFVR
jgi:TonB family protein